MESLSTCLSEQTIRQIGWVLVHFLWQGCTVGAVLWAVLKILNRASSNTRYLAACAGMALMMAAPVVTFTVLNDPEPITPAPQVFVAKTFVAAETFQETTVAAAETISTEIQQIPLGDILSEKLEAALPWCVIGWAAGVAALSLWYLGGWCQLQKLRLIGTRPASEQIAAQTMELAQRLGITRAVRITESMLVQVPTMIGWLKPVILLPATAVTGLDEMQLRAMIAHELAHIKRHDYLVNIIQTAFEILGFYHPAVWWMSKQVRIERENCCDDMAAELVQDRTAYAKALFSMEEIRIQQLSLAMRASGGSLIDRIGRLLGKSETAGPKSGWIAILTISFVVVFLISTAVAMNNRSVQPSLTDTNSTLEFRLVANMNREQVVGFNGADINLAGYEWVPVKNSSDSVWHNNMPRRNVGDDVQLMVSNQQSTTMLADGSWGLEKAIVSSDELGNPAIEIFFDAAGREKFYTLTNNHIQRQLAICIDGKVYSAPHIMTAVRSAAIITGNFTEEEARSLATALAKGMPSVVLKEPAISGVEHYMVNRTVAEFPQAEDFSSPESAYAAINRVMASGSREGWMRVSTKANAQRIAQSQRQDQPVPAEWAKVVLNARILKVLIQDDRAMVIAEFGQDLSSQKIVNPIDARSLKLEDGRWLNAGEDRFDTVEQAAKKFGAIVEREDKTEHAYRTALDDPSRFQQMAEELFDKLRSADYEEILSYYDTYSGHWRQDGWKKLGLNYTVYTDWPSFAAWVCRTFRDNPITSVELDDAILSEKEFDGHKSPAVPYKLTLKDGQALQGELYFAYRASSDTWQPAEGIDWHLQDNPAKQSKGGPGGGMGGFGGGMGGSGGGMGGSGGAPISDPQDQIIFPKNWNEIAQAQGEDPNRLSANFKPINGMQIVVYDITDFLAGSFDQDYLPGQAGVNRAAERLIKEIEAIVPESWRSNGGQGQVNVHGTTKLMIRQTPEVHEKIADHLAQRRIQVAIEARFILADDSFEQSLGFEEDAKEKGRVTEGLANSDEIKAAMQTKPLAERDLPAVSSKPSAQSGLYSFDSKTERLIIRAVQSFKNAKTLTAPKALVMNSESASMRVGNTHSFVDAANETREIDQGVVLDLLPVVQDDNKTILLKTHIQVTNILDERAQVIGGKEYSIPWVQVTTIPFQAQVESGGTILVRGPEVGVKNEQTGELEKQRLFVLLKPTALAAPEDK